MMDTATAARAVEGRMLGANVRFTRVATDTRTLAPGDLFVALKGERFDGHDFVDAARERGAAAALVALDRADALPGNRIAVPDPLAALGVLAAHWRARFALPVIRDRRQQRQDDGEGNAGGDPARAFRRRARARDRRQPQQRDRPSADDPPPPRRSMPRPPSSSA